MSGTIPCSKVKCFQNFCGLGCRLLSKPIRKHDCPFCKTQEEVDEKRLEAHMRLEKLDRYDLIDKYENNPERRW